MRTYTCVVTGIAHEGRAKYIRSNVPPGTALRLVPEPDNPYDADAVAVYHRKRLIGYIPKEKRWVAASISEGDEHEVVAEELRFNDEGQPSVLAIRIAIVADGEPDEPDEPDEFSVPSGPASSEFIASVVSAGKASIAPTKPNIYNRLAILVFALTALAVAYAVFDIQYR